MSCTSCWGPVHLWSAALCRSTSTWDAHTCFLPITSPEISCRYSGKPERKCPEQNTCCACLCVHTGLDKIRTAKPIGVPCHYKITEGLFPQYLQGERFSQLCCVQIRSESPVPGALSVYSSKGYSITHSLQGVSRAACGCLTCLTH